MARTYEAMKKGKSSILNNNSWQYPEFRNKKQTGDLEKKILFYKQKSGCKTFNFTCSRGQEGVSTVIVNLANYMAKKKKNEKILLVDCNFVNPVLQKAFGISFDQGISNCLFEDASISDVIQDIPNLNMRLLTCGNGYRELNNGFDQEKFIALFEDIKAEYDTILIDSSPLLTSSESLSAAIVADVTFMVIQALKTTNEVAQRALTILTDNECHVGGGVLNRVQRGIPGWMYKIL